MEKKETKIPLPKMNLDDLFSTQEERDSANLEKVVEVKLSDIITGSFFSSFSITIGMSLYIFYLTNISNASNYYGSLTNFILLLLVIYYSSYVVLLGVQINHMLFKRKRILQMEDS